MTNQSDKKRRHQHLSHEGRCEKGGGGGQGERNGRQGDLCYLYESTVHTLTHSIHGMKDSKEESLSS